MARRSDVVGPGIGCSRAGVASARFKLARPGGSTRLASSGGHVVLQACIKLGSDPACVRVARHFVDETVLDWKLDAVRDDARLIATELASNAVMHARSPFRLTMKCDRFDARRIEVRDNSHFPPHRLSGWWTPRAGEDSPSSPPSPSAGGSSAMATARRSGLRLTASRPAVPQAQ